MIINYLHPFNKIVNVTYQRPYLTVKRVQSIPVMEGFSLLPAYNDCDLPVSFSNTKLLPE